MSSIGDGSGNKIRRLELKKMALNGNYRIRD